MPLRYEKDFYGGKSNPGGGSSDNDGGGDSGGGDSDTDDSRGQPDSKTTDYANDPGGVKAARELKRLEAALLASSSGNEDSDSGGSPPNGNENNGGGGSSDNDGDRGDNAQNRQDQSPGGDNEDSAGSPSNGNGNEGWNKSRDWFTTPNRGPEIKHPPAIDKTDSSSPTYSSMSEEDFFEYVAKNHSIAKAKDTSQLSQPAEGTETSEFGDPRELNGSKWRHRGIDIANKIGTPINAASTGRVSKVGYSATLGHYVEIDHIGMKTVYAHMNSKPSVVEGNMVPRGGVIGNMGSSGNSTGPHLHFEVIVSGEPRDPKDYLIGDEDVK